MTVFIKWLSITCVVLIVSTLTLLFLSPVPPLMDETRFSRAVFADQKQLLRLTLSPDGKYRLKTRLADISPLVVKSTLLQEDQYFYWHPGINPVSIVKALTNTYFIGSRRIGASTITMQVARIRYGINSKSIGGKVWQIIRALQLEVHYSKDEILEAYLNLAPYGNNIEGIGAASLIYFGKMASDLSLPEVLTLVVIPQNPTKRIPDQGKLKEVRQKLFKRWLAHYPEDKNKLALFELPLQMRRLRQLPFLAPHFVEAVLSDPELTQSHLVTTLDLRLQKTLETVVRQYLARKAVFNVENAVVLLIDTRNMGVKAMLGSASYFNHRISGQVNGVEAKRSPGSALKPFIYGLALDQGLIHPATVLKDVPRSFGTYNPENFDNDFVGPIKARDALALSRNIPAVYLADQLKNPSLYDFLQQAKVKGLKAESYYGLALVLGGAEVTMRELTELYAMLVNEGRLQPIQMMESKKTLPSTSLLSPEASFLVLDMLRDNHAIDSRQQTPLQITWKTGTSSGYRDAWTVGSFGPYAMAVWIGNFDNRSNPAFIGKLIAAPLFFEIANAINAQFGPLPVIQKHPERLNLTKVDVCKASGLLPTRYCKDLESEWFIPGKSPIKTDTIYREVAIDKTTGKRACQFGQNTRFEIYEFWPSDLLKIFKKAGIQRRLPPPYDSNCETAFNSEQGISPQISSPQAKINYIARIDSVKANTIPFIAVVDADVRELHWFLDETYLGKTNRDVPYLWSAKPGNFTLRVVDDHGRSDAVRLKVSLES